ncbi:ImmA/IrrE family metallo-endopeptidase [Chroococcidiopsis sp. FACHB-1243]|uniref:helix-turn-helix domain-containing protein n=1 Tax=Chroococcidiopsis sp. [FACHB-1243] TaxID=2692781 RepID=UPI00178187F5|nr:XRE family transcriptional regulator [Chroococcidiopsis sp. [FACHB-1243]]MBD2303963.1 ImmA/IrrE family metallo-endopeptidase [Chroococcidiopsis sp. [FACHB-1243]]
MNYAELGRRIRQAREEAALPQDVVAQHLGLPRSAISLIESGKRKLDSLELRNFSHLVGKSIDFFLEEEIPVDTRILEDDDPTQILFSANQVVDISQDREQIERFRQFHRDFAHLARMLNRLPNPYPNKPLHDVYKLTPGAARWMANCERARLGLPSCSPVRDMHSILLSQGIRVMAWDLRTAKLGGCFIFSQTLGSFVLVKRNLKQYSAYKINFVLAHEYCHHLIHRQLKGITCNPNQNYRKPEEYFAQWFAANFLMPEEALVPRLQEYLKQESGNGAITDTVVMNLALDFGVSYTAMLNRMTSKGIELIDSETRKRLEKVKVRELLAKLGRSIPHFAINEFPEEYEQMVAEAYDRGYIESEQLPDLLNKSSLEEAKAYLNTRKTSAEFDWNNEDEYEDEF